MHSKFLKLKVLSIAIEQNSILVKKNEDESYIIVSPGDIEILTSLINTMGRMQSMIKAGFELKDVGFKIMAGANDTISISKVDNDNTVNNIKWEEIDSVIDDLNESVKIFIDHSPKQSRSATNQYNPYNS